MSGILVFGRAGQVATELQRLGSVTALGRDAADLADPDACGAAVRAHSPRAVINAAAYTAVDRAEEEEPLATTINGAAPTAMAEACAALAIPLVHISTDYIFAGNGTRPWLPNSPPAPQNAYGRSKLVGEDGIRAVGAAHAILRTSWVFSAHGGNFVKAMLRLCKSRDTLSVVDDQIGCADPKKSGTYHFSGAPDTSWCNFARAIFEQVGYSTSIKPIATSDYPTPASRPLNSRMDCEMTEQVFAIHRPYWRSGLADTITELGIAP